MRRRQPKDLSDSWKPRRSLRVYLDDIEELFELLGAVGNVAAETKDFVDIANADDLHTLDEDEDVNELLLKVSDDERSASVRLGRPTEIWISARNDYEMRGVFDAMRELLTKRELFCIG